ncbi:hypothetical protein MALG_05094 (plasmid) [Marinovum algicola DG 898]|nr:hypothetical protein MALG_05094 [Marinovum algicola DG 898]
MAALRLVGGVEDLVDEAQSAHTESGRQVLAQAEHLATRTVELIRKQRDGATLASVAFAIKDDCLRLAFLEQVGEKLA